MTNEVVIISSPADYWTVSTSIFSTIAALTAVIIAGLSYRHSKKVSSDAATDNKESARLAEEAASANRQTMIAQKDLVKEQKRLVDQKIEHDKLSVRPELGFVLQLIRDKKTDFNGLAISNFGLGPATLGLPLLIIDNDPVSFMRDSDETLIVNKLKECGAPDKMGVFFFNGHSSFIPAGGRLSVMTIPDGCDLNEGIRWFESMGKRLNVVIPYTSAYYEDIRFCSVYDCNHSVYPKEKLERFKSLNIE